MRKGLVTFFQALVEQVQVSSVSKDRLTRLQTVDRINNRYLDNLNYPRDGILLKTQTLLFFRPYRPIS